MLYAVVSFRYKMEPLTKTPTLFLVVFSFLVILGSSAVLGMQQPIQNRRQSVLRWEAPGSHGNNISGYNLAGPYRQCQKYSCPPSKVVEDRGSYKIVYFEDAPYAKARREGDTLLPAALNLYDRLRGYIMGDNQNKEMLPMTAPVILRVDPSGDGLWSPKNFTMFFYIDPSVKSPPVPTDQSIDVLSVNSYTLFIRTFYSYTVSYADWMRELLQLVADVEADGEDFVKTFFYFASYDPPTQMTGRVNEVQLLKPTTAAERQ